MNSYFSHIAPIRYQGPATDEALAFRHYDKGRIVLGKTVAELGTYGRVVATLSERFAGPGTAEAWSQSRGFTRRVGLYLRYPELGVDLLRMAGSDDLVVAWSREHHLPPEDWTVPHDLGTVLAAADESAYL